MIAYILDLRWSLLQLWRRTDETYGTHHSDNMEHLYMTNILSPKHWTFHPRFAQLVTQKDLITFSCYESFKYYITDDNCDNVEDLYIINILLFMAPSSFIFTLPINQKFKISYEEITRNNMEVRQISPWTASIWCKYAIEVTSCVYHEVRMTFLGPM
jgi:hypothetical protein